MYVMGIVVWVGLSILDKNDCETIAISALNVTSRGA